MEKTLKSTKKKINTDNLYKQMNDLNKEKKREEERISTKRRTQNIIIICIILILVGLANFYSAILRFDNKIVFNKIFKHFLIISLALSSFFITSIVDFKFFKKNRIRFLFLILGISAFLIVAFFPNKDLFPSINGGKGWIRIKGFSLQVTELFKVPYIIMIASIFSRGKDDNSEINYFKNLISCLIYLVIFLGLLICLKDLGTGIHYVAITLFLIFMTDIPNKWLYSLIGLALTASSAVFFYFYKIVDGGYKQQRLKTFIAGLIENKYDRFDAYQIYQSLLGLGTGGLFGKGYGNGVQKYSYIPEVETDFAISTFGEEMGLIGMFLILLTFLILFILIMNVAENSKTYFGKYLAAGIAGYYITQVIINIGVAIGLIPILGIPLPFISSGGSSLLALSTAMGLIININNSKLKTL